MMEILSGIAFSLLTHPDSNSLPASEIIVDGVKTGKIIQAATLEAAFATEMFYLLFTTDDNPFEEFLTVYLFDRSFNRIDSASIGAPYSTGNFKFGFIQQPDKVFFRFINDAVWCLRLLVKPKFSIPFLGEPFGVWRRFKFSRHFTISVGV